MFGFPSGMGSIMNAFFTGDFDDFVHGGGSRKTKSVSRALPVSLADLYNGRRIQIPHTSAVPCVACNGYGSRSMRSNVCTACRGKGARLMMRQMGMMMQQMSVACETCGGSGRKTDPRDVCPVCMGKRVTVTESSLDVHIEPGMCHHDQLTFSGEGDWNPQTGEADDIVIVLEQVKDKQFQREDDDLHMTHTISLAESLCGFQFVFKHLDGRDLIVRRERGEITRPDEVKVVTGEGMPRRQRPGQFGDLVIKFQVVFPEMLDESQVDLLRTALPPPKSVDVNHYKDVEECYLSREELDTLRRELEEEAREEDDGPTVGCASQ